MAALRALAGAAERGPAPWLGRLKEALHPGLLRPLQEACAVTCVLVGLAPWPSAGLIGWRLTTTARVAPAYSYGYWPT
jgi:hypothetical protein